MNKKIVYSTLCLLLQSFLILNAQNAADQYIPGHKAAVTVLQSDAISGSIFSGGEDGFIIEQRANGSYDRYQVSELEIREIAIRPNSNDIAVYETDGFSLHRISVLDWKTKKKKFAKRFSASILTIAYSGSGSYLIAGTTSLNSLYFFDAENGAQKNLLTQSESLASLVVTGAAETGMVVYSSAGTISYYDLKTGALRTQFNSIANLKSPILHKNNLLLSAVAGNEVVTVDMLSGNAINSFVIPDDPELQNVFIAAAPSDDECLFFFVYDDKISVRNYGGELTALRYTPDAPICRIAKNGNHYALGDESGSLYSLSIEEKLVPSSVLNSNAIAAENESGALIQPKEEAATRENGSDGGEIEREETEPDKIEYTAGVELRARDIFDAINDIAVAGETLYILANDGLYASPTPFSSPALICAANEVNRISEFQSGLLAWSDQRGAPVIYIDPLSGESRELFTAQNAITSLTCFQDQVLYIENFSDISVYDYQSKKKIFSYTGAGLQNAALIDKSTIVVTKTVSSQPQTPLLYINIKTGETVPAISDGDMMYGLTIDESSANGYAYVIYLDREAGIKTALTEIDLSNKSFRTIATHSNETLNAFLCIDKRKLYTNLGEDAVTVIQLSSMRNARLPRAESIPIDARATNNYVIVRNMNGSIAWYNKQTEKLLSVLNLKKNGEWFVAR